MFEVPISIENPHDFSKKQELFSVGVPFPKGAVEKGVGYVLLDASTGDSIPYSFRELASWSDNSIKWGLLSFCLDMLANEKKSLSLSLNGQANNKAKVSFESVELKGDNELLSAAKGAMSISPKSFSPFHTLSSEGGEGYSSKMLLALGSGVELVPVVNQCTREVIENSEGNSFEQLSFDGSFQGVAASETDSARALKFSSVLSIYPESGLLKVDFTLWNSNAAQHPGGCWDLGDSGSTRISSLAIKVSSKAKKCQWRIGADSEWRSSQSFCLSQSGSGAHNAEHFNIHKNKDGAVADFFNGYQVFENTRNEAGLNREVQGGRANPEMLIAEQGNKGLSVALKDFWQNFPKLAGFEASEESSELVIDLFPVPNGADYHELQGGERKTHTVYFALNSDIADLNWVNNQSSLSVCPKWMVESKVMPFLNASTSQDPFAPLIGLGLEGERSFLKKRELIDEYGWRHFGDIYADHETLYQSEGEAPFVSHYNNQYDCVLGFARQYLQTGDQRWFALMDELARHVNDIDVYHTDDDRVEYNRGLFWHTDHYLDAHTCTHRTFSKYNDTSSTPGQTGGGPGTEHCYTTGLLYHYYMTGNKSSKEVVEGLAEWMINIHDGAPSLLAQVLSAKNNELKTLIQLLKGNSPLPYRYPFTRGTGNFITALLDAYALSGDESKLSRAESVIRETLHPKDDISLRNLGNIEDTWSYVVMLQAVTKYLSVKESIEQFDEPYFYARASLLHYVDWIADNEQPYLNREEILEFPNDTWVAQEMRKLNLLISGAMYSKDKRTTYLARASEFRDYIVKTLSDSSERDFSRIQILLLQNYGPHFYCDDQSYFDEFDKTVAARVDGNDDFGAVKKLSRSALIFAIIKKLFKGLKVFSIQREKDWVRTRRS